jgi:uncharacterized SAM-binding protein YcdF (DUF218 family)
MLAWTLGFLWFATYVATIPPCQIPQKNSQRATLLATWPHADAAVVLTGSPGRVATGLQLVLKGLSNRLFVSGVSPNTKLRDLILADPTIPDTIAWRRADVVMGHNAYDTRTNAQEVATWVQTNRYHTLYLVTSDYHIPRSYLWFAHTMPDTTWIMCPVRTVRPGMHPALYRSTRVLLWKEYNKWLLTVVELAWKQ